MMQSKHNFKNKVELSGKLMNPFNYSHSSHGEYFYKSFLQIQRLSGNMDIIPVIINESALLASKVKENDFVHIKGEYRSYNQMEDEKNHLILSVYVRQIHLQEDGEKIFHNHIALDGYICRIPKHRITPLGRKITDLLLAVNYPYGKTAYIPCICWGNNAIVANTMKVGDNIRLRGRIQSRIYLKNDIEGKKKELTAWEVSASLLEIVQDTY